jgi:hypothetical protein
MSGRLVNDRKHLNLCFMICSHLWSVLYELLFSCSLILVTMWHVNVFFELPFSYNSLMLILVYPGRLNLCYHVTSRRRWWSPPCRIWNQQEGKGVGDELGEEEREDREYSFISSMIDSVQRTTVISTVNNSHTWPTAHIHGWQLALFSHACNLHRRSLSQLLHTITILAVLSYLSSEHLLFGTFMSRRALHHGVVWAGWYGVVCQVYGQYNCSLGMEGPFRFNFFLRIYDLIRRYPDRSSNLCLDYFQSHFERNLLL